uniref:Uncharacterized protein n=1 Tax=Romanomermis culicivorax TaxID=13658 RepID=A0A915IXL1_ROMCU
MSLYDGTDLSKQIKIEDSKAQPATISSNTTPTSTSNSWSSSGLKLLQSHMQLKKASATPI